MANIFTAGQVIGYVALKIEDADQTNFTAAQYLNAVLLAQEQFALDGKCIMEEATVTMVASQSLYNYPSDFLVAILFRSNGLKLTPTDKLSLSFQSGQDWTTLNPGTIIAVYDNGNGQFGVVPAPDAQNAAYPFLLDYVAMPADPSSTSSQMLNGLQFAQYYVPAITNWAASEMMTYRPLTADAINKRNIFLKDYERYKDQAIMIYNNLVDEPIQMAGGQFWNDQNLITQGNAFTDDA